MFNELKTYINHTKEAGHEIFFAVTSDDYTEWDRGSGDLAKAVEMLEEATAIEGNAVIAIIDVDDSFCLDEMDLIEAKDELHRIA